MSLLNYDPTKPVQSAPVVAPGLTTQATPTTETSVQPETGEHPANGGGWFIPFVQNLPTTMLRTVVQPAEYVMKLGSTLGDAMAKNETLRKITGRKNYNPEGYTPGTVTLPGQTEPLYNSQRFNSFSEGAGATAEAALNLYMAMSGAALIKGATKVGIEGAIKAAGEKGGKELSKNLAKVALKDAGLGMGYGASAALQEKNPTAGKVLTSAAVGAAIGVALPPVVGKFAEAGGMVLKQTGRAVSSAIDNTALSLERKAAQPLAEGATRLYEKIDTAVPSFTEKAAAKGAEILRGVQKLPERAQTLLIDKYHPIRVFQQKVNKMLGTNLNLVDQVQEARTVGAGIATDKLQNTYVPMVKKYGSDWTYVKEYSRYLDALDRLQNGDVIEKNATAGDVLQSLNDLKTTLGPQKMQFVKEGAGELQNFLDGELQGAVRSGRISQASYDAIKEAHPNYLPHNVLDYLDNADPTKIGNIPSGSFNVSKSGVTKSQGGSIREIDDIDTAIARGLLKQNTLNETNQATGAIVDAGAKVGFAKPLRTAENVNLRIERAKQLNDILDQNKSDVGVISSVKGEEKKAAKQIATLGDATFDKSITNLQSRIDNSGNEISQVFTEGWAKAAELDDDAEVTKMLSATADKVIKREQLIAARKEKLDAKITAFNGKKFDTVQEKAQYINDLKADRKALEAVVDERRGDAADLRKALSALKDTKMKSVDVPPDMEKISYFKNGVREDWLIPKDVGMALKNLDGESASAIGNWFNNTKLGRAVTAPARVVRRLATGVNPVFATFTNPLRDVQTTAITAPVEAQDIYKGLISSITQDKTQADGLYRRAMRAGVFTTTIFREEQDPQKVFLESLHGGGFVDELKHGRVDKMVETVGQRLEESTRLAVFNHALANGMGDVEAARIARNATVDFSKSGVIIQQANRVIPFLNARVQGAVNVVKAATDNPQEFTRRAMWAGAAPAALLTAHNAKYASYNNIPDYEKQKYWIFMVGEHNGFDTSGRPVQVPNYIKIPKGETQQLVSSGVERILNLGMQQNRESTGKFLANLAYNFSPVTESSLLPAGLQQAIELKTNKSLFTGKNIVPDTVKFGNRFFNTKELPAKYRYNPQFTSSIATNLGRMLGVSPAQIDYLLKTGVLNDLSRLPDVSWNSKQTLLDNVSNLPFIRTIFGNNSSANYSQKKEFIRQMKENFNTKFLDVFLKNNK